jgi:S-adenosylmethionine/arginine decarboxylase-like enzyme
MEACELYFWDDHEVPEAERQTEPHTKGTSAIQFILTSNITIHTLDILERVYINVFSCKEFDELAAAAFSRDWFHGDIQQCKTIERI